MYLVSCRRKLFSPYLFSSTWEVLCIPSYPKETNLEQARLSEKTISELCWGKRVLVLVHGYNSDGAGLLRAYSTIEQRGSGLSLARQPGFLRLFHGTDADVQGFGVSGKPAPVHPQGATEAGGCERPFAGLPRSGQSSGDYSC